MGLGRGGACPGPHFYEKPRFFENRPVWSRLALSGSSVAVWRRLGPFEALWNRLGLSGAVWNVWACLGWVWVVGRRLALSEARLGLFGSLRSRLGGTVWNRLAKSWAVWARLASSVAVWACLVRF